MKHEKGGGTYDEAPVIRLPVSEGGYVRRSRNIPNEGVQLLRSIVIGDDIGVNWGAKSETESGLKKTKWVILVWQMSA